MKIQLFLLKTTSHSFYCTGAHIPPSFLLLHLNILVILKILLLTGTYPTLAVDLFSPLDMILELNLLPYSLLY